MTRLVCVQRCVFLSTFQFDSDFGKEFEGKAELFIRKWETNIIPKLMKADSLELPEDLANPVSSMNDSDGKSNFQEYALETFIQ